MPRPSRTTARLFRSKGLYARKKQPNAKCPRSCTGRSNFVAALALMVLVGGVIYAGFVLYLLRHLGSSLENAANRETHKPSKLSLNKAKTKTLLPGLPEGRSERFPSVDERVRIYMGDWYLPPCNDNKIQYCYNPDTSVTLSIASSSSLREQQHQKQQQQWTYTSDPASWKVFVAQQQDIANCTQMVARRNHFNLLKRNEIVRLTRECQDLQRSVPLEMLHTTSSSSNDNQTRPPVLARFGDISQLEPIPFLQQWRPAMSRQELLELTRGKSSCQVVAEEETRRRPPIVWHLNTARHFGALPGICDMDIPWHEKQSKAVFRGALTGQPDVGVEEYSLVGTNPTRDREEHTCLLYPRCRLVYSYFNSRWIDARLTGKLEPLHSSTIKGKELKASRKMSLVELLQFKILVFLEGNDISSGLKWGLLSRSVVLMPPPTKIGWTMEERLQPYVHYVPLWPNLTNVEDQIQWILQNEDKSQEIAHRGSLWIQDLVFHPQAAVDNAAVYKEILERYSAHFHSASSCVQRVGSASTVQ